MNNAIKQQPSHIKELFKFFVNITKYLTLSLTILLITQSPAFAQSAGLSISPPVIEILMKPNKSVIQAITLTNQGDYVNIVPSLHKIKPTDSYGHVSVDPTPLDPATIPISLSLENSNIALNESFLLHAGESTQLVLKISSATISEPEDSYVALTLTPATQASTTPISNPSISALLLVTVSPDGSIPISLEITNFFPPLLHDSSNPLSLEAKISNNTPSMIRPAGKFKVINSRGKAVFESDIYPNLLLGDSDRYIMLQSSFKNEEISASPLIWKPSFWDMGPHQLIITITSRNGTIYTEQSRTVWVLPLQSLIYVILIAIMLYLLLNYKSKEKTIKNNKKENESPSKKDN